MNDLTSLLRDADPVRDGESLAPEDAQRMRRVVIGAVHPEPQVAAWRRPLAIAVVVALLIGLSGGGNDRIDQVSTGGASTTIASPASSAPDGRRQLQFSTPGGTRIIWIFDENLRLQESMP